MQCNGKAFSEPFYRISVRRRPRVLSYQNIIPLLNIQKSTSKNLDFGSMEFLRFIEPAVILIIKNMEGLQQAEIR